MRFPKIDFEIPAYENEAYILSDPRLRENFIKRYQKTAALYYSGQPSFEELLERIKEHIRHF